MRDPFIRLNRNDKKFIVFSFTYFIIELTYFCNFEVSDSTRSSVFDVHGLLQTSEYLSVHMRSHPSGLGV